MPIRKSRRGRRPDFTELNKNQRYEMLHGCGWLPPGMSDDDMRAAWALHRDSLRVEWAENNPPGTRCFAEWLCEIIPRFGERPTTKWWTPEHKYHRAAWLVHGILHVHTWPAMQEPEHVFLFRVGYIDEAEYLAAKAIYDAAHEGEEAFIAGALQRAEKWDRQRQQRLHSEGADHAEEP